MSDELLLKGVEFILDHAKNGDGLVRGEVKNLMYIQALKITNEEDPEKQLRNLLYTCGDSVRGYCFDSVPAKDPCCWVGSKFMDIIQVDFGGHRIVAENVFFMTEGEFEKRYAKITKGTKSPEEALSYVEKKYITRAMERMVCEIMDGTWSER